MIINDKTVPFPLDEIPNKNQRVFFPDLMMDDPIDSWLWSGDKGDITLLRRGLVHDTPEAARAHAEALLAPSMAESGRVEKLLAKYKP